MMRRGTLPNLFLPGFPKCGTTTLFHWLAQHPAIFGPAVKEPDYFHDTSAEAAGASWRRYMELYAEAGGHSWRMDASTNYVLAPMAIDRIEAAVPGARYIVSLRDPVALVWSAFRHNLYHQVENITDFAEAWAVQDDPDRGGYGMPRLCREPQWLRYRSTASVGSHLGRLFDRVGKDRVRVVLLEDLARQPGEVSQGLFAWLELQVPDGLDLERRNVARVARSPAVQRLVKELVLLKRKIGIPRIGTKLLPRLSDWNGVPDDEHRTVPPSVRAWLQPELEAEIARVEALLDLDLAHWRRP